MSSQPPVTQNEADQLTTARFPRLERQLSLFIVILVVALVLIMTVVSFILTQRSMRQSLSERLRDLAGVIAMQVDGELHATLVDNDQQFSQDYNRVRNVLVRAAKTSPEIAFVYTLRRIDDEIVFVVDSDPIPAGINEVYADAPEFAYGLFDTITAPVAGEEIYTDEFGTFQTAYAPVYNSLGSLEAILAVDIDAAFIRARELENLGILLAVAVPLLLILSGLGFLYGRQLASAIVTVYNAAQRYSAGDLSQRIPPSRGWSLEAHNLAQSFNGLADNLSEAMATMEARIAARTEEANRRTAYVQAASEVAAATSSVMDSERLVRLVVDLIRENFKLYYVGLFLLDPKGEWAVLRAGTGDAGLRMMARGHRIQVGQGMIGWTIANAQARIALEAGEDSVRLASSELPLTRSEAAIPLRSRERVLGALTVQSAEANAFDQSLLLTFQTMADQIGVSLDNARLLAESQAALDAAQRSYQQITQRGWLDFLRAANSARAYLADERGVAPVNLADISAPGAADSGRQVELPVKVRGLELGRIVASKPANRGEWHADELELIQDIVEQINTALENARLYSETQRSAERERILSEITATVRGSTSVDAIMQNAVRQLAAALNVPQAAIRLYTSERGSQPASEDTRLDSSPGASTGPALKQETLPTNGTPAEAQDPENPASDSDAGEPTIQVSDTPANE